MLSLGSSLTKKLGQALQVDNLFTKFHNYKVLMVIDMELLGIKCSKMLFSEFKYSISV